jgi:hypothetical protein
MTDSKPTSAELLNETECNLCARRDGCMPYSDEDLVSGMTHGHVPLKGECILFVQGNEQTKEVALDNLNDFNTYAKNLVQQAGTPA